MTRRAWCLSLIVVLVSGIVPVGFGQAQPRAPLRIGVLTTSFGFPPHAVGLRDGLRALGHRENEHFVLGVRFTGGDLKALSVAAHELVEAGSDLIFAAGANPALAARAATERVPIVFAAVGDPLALGLVESIARPGRNVTGIADRDIELGPKRLEIFKALVPGLRRILYLHDGNDTYSVELARVYHDAARRLGLQLVARAVRTEREAQAVLAGIEAEQVQGIVGPTHASLNIPGFLLDTATRQRLPIMGSAAFMVEAGGLAAYGPDFYETGRQAARLVDKIVKGAKAGDIPVEMNSKIELSINIGVAEALGLTIAPEVVLRADRIVR